MARARGPSLSRALDRSPNAFDGAIADRGTTTNDDEFRGLGRRIECMMILELDTFQRSTRASRHGGGR